MCFSMLLKSVGSHLNRFKIDLESYRPNCGQPKIDLLIERHCELNQLTVSDRFVIELN